MFVILYKLTDVIFVEDAVEQYEIAKLGSVVSMVTIYVT